MQTKDELKTFAVNTVGAVLWHPFVLSRTLMQLGHEPYMPTLQRTLAASLKMSSRMVYLYPNIFEYIKHLKKEVGIIGIFSIGLPARLTYGVISTKIARNIRLYLEPEVVGYEAEERARKRRTGEESEYEFMVHTLCIAASRTAGVVASYPLYVVMVRQMAYICGGDEAYQTLCGTIAEIYNSEGFRGFFSGVGPRAFAEMVSVIVSAGLAFLTNKYILAKHAPDAKEMTHIVTGLVAGSLTYKYNVLACCMAVDRAKLDVAMGFDSTRATYRYLAEKGLFSRGGSFFWRRAPLSAVPNALRQN